MNTATAAIETAANEAKCPVCGGAPRPLAMKVLPCWECVSKFDAAKREAALAFVGPIEVHGVERVACPTCNAKAGARCHQGWSLPSSIWTGAHPQRYRVAARAEVAS